MDRYICSFSRSLNYTKSLNSSAQGETNKKIFCLLSFVAHHCRSFSKRKSKIFKRSLNDANLQKKTLVLKAKPIFVIFALENYITVTPSQKRH